MITRIVKDFKSKTLYSYSEIKDKLDYFRSFRDNLYNLSDDKFDAIRVEFKKFNDLHLAFFADKYPTKLFRLTINKRILQGKNERLTKISQLMAPPVGVSNYGRCNLPGECVFYAALDINTAIWETQPEVGDLITISEWSIKDGCKIDTHTIFNPFAKNDSKDAQKAYQAYLQSSILPIMADQNPEINETLREIMFFLSQEFMKPVMLNQSKNYLFSGLYSSEFLQTPPDGNGFKIEAISYPSVKMELGLTNIAILNELVPSKLNLDSITIMKIAETNYNSKALLSQDVIKIIPPEIKVTNFDHSDDQIIYNKKDELHQVVEWHTKYLESKINGS